VSLKLNNITKSYGSNIILNDVNFEIDLGQLSLITGPSGSGKTTLLRIISLLEKLDAGSIELDGEAYRYAPLERSSGWDISMPYRKKLCLVFQQLFMWPHMTIRQSIDRTARNGFNYDLLVARLDIDHILDRYPNEVSLGQRQRAALVRALSTQADYFLFDEITSALDEAATNTVTEIIEEQIKDNNKAVVLVTHAPDKLSALASSTYLIVSNGGLISV
jgi:ABC-type sugar transport system ATPase subunit